MNTSKFFVLLLLCTPVIASAQRRDTNYIEPYAKILTTRIYLSQKYTTFGIEGSQGFKEVLYHPNTKLSLGVGATYRALTLNLGYGFSFLNPETGQGKTKYLDLQTHIYGIKWKFDLFAQFYKGYHLRPKGFASADKNSYYRRPDLLVQELGVSAFHIYNNKRFSYRAAFQQSEWQKKSAGSFLLGGSITYGNIKADSAFIPSVLAQNYQQKEIKEIRYIELGPGAGYAYTFVWKKNWYIIASVTINLDLGLIKETSSGTSLYSYDFAPNSFFRFGMGYNNRNWNTNFFWISNRTAMQGQFSNGGYTVSTGNFRLTLTKRIVPWAELKKILRHVDKLLDGR